MISRRSFLGQASLLTAGVIIVPQLLMAKSGRKYGLQLFSLREQLPKDVSGVIAKVAEAGYKQVETFGYSKKQGFWGMSAADFGKLLKNNGLTTPSGHYGMDSFLASGQTGDLDDAIEAANILGQSYVTVPYIDQRLRKTTDDLKSLASWINIGSKRVQAAGLKMAYHNHNFEFLDVGGQKLMDVLLKSTDPDLVDFEMDVYWVVRAGQDPLQWLDYYPGRFKLIHVKDMDKTNQDLNTEVGNGSIDFKSILAAATQQGAEYFIVEQENYKIDPYVSITQSNKYLRDVLG